MADELESDARALATELHKMMSNNTLFMPLDCCIFRVPPILSRHNPSAYAPTGFSIGPFHYKKLPPMTEATQKIKLKYLHHLISRPWAAQDYNHEPEARLRSITEAVTGLREEARKRYAGLQGLSAIEFTHVLVLDGCFLVELFRKKAYNDQLVEEDDPIFSMSCLLQYLRHDLILIENQIPWFVLNTLFEMTISAIDTKPLVQLVIEFFGNIFSASRPSTKLKSSLCLSNLNEQSNHILDLLRNSLIMTSNVQNNVTMKWQPMPSATSLREAGIKFSSGSSNCILDIQFDEDGKLEIPPLFIQETTEAVFRNLICLEQCCPKYDPVITSYAILMDNLINTASDMEILTKSHAIHNWLNIEDATNFFNKLYNDTYIKRNYYHHLTNQVNTYCMRRWPRWRMVLMHHYFRHPWALISVIVAAFLLIFSFLQTLFTIIK